MGPSCNDAIRVDFGKAFRDAAGPLPCPERVQNRCTLPLPGSSERGFRGRRGEAAAGFTIIERWNGCGPRMGRFAVLVPDRRRAW